MSKRIWNHKYVAGNPEMFTKVIHAADNPRTRAVALEDAEKVANNGGAVGWSITGRARGSSRASAKSCTAPLQPFEGKANERDSYRGGA